MEKILSWLPVNKKTHTDADAVVKYLPPEILEKILSRLPVKSLLRFKSACKSWNNLISSHSFIRTHLLHSSRSLFIGQYSSFSRIQKFHRFRFEDERYFHVHPINHVNRNFILRLWCSCSGIILLESRSGDGGIDGDLILWNPSMRKITMLFLPLEVRKIINISLPIRGPRCVNYGLCYDPATMDLKVVVFYGDVNYAVYSCKNKSWSKQKKVVADGIANNVMYSIDARYVECVDGALYWIIRSGGGYGDLLCFESEGDRLKRVKRPGDLKERAEFSLITMEGQLCALSCSEGAFVARIWMWTREEGEEVWRDFMRIEDVPKRVWTGEAGRVEVWRDKMRSEAALYVDEVIMVCLESRRGMTVYHPPEKTSLEEFEFEFDLALYDENENKNAPTFLFSCADSLLFFDQHPFPPRNPNGATAAYLFFNALASFFHHRFKAVFHQ